MRMQEFIACVCKLCLDHSPCLPNASVVEGIQVVVSGTLGAV